VIVAPDLVEDLLAVEDLALVLDEELQQLELAHGGLDLLAVLGERLALEVEDELAELEAVRDALLLVAALAAQDGVDPGDHLADVERLGDVVIGPEVEAHDLVDLLVLRGEDDDRDLDVVLLERLADLEAGDPREHDVQDDQVGRAVHGELEAALTVVRGEDVVPLELEVLLQPEEDRRIILDDQ